MTTIRLIILAAFAALVLAATAGAQWADPAEYRYLKDDPTRVTAAANLDTVRPPVPDIPAASRPDVPCNPYVESCNGEPVRTASRPSIPTGSQILLSPNQWNYQGCIVTLTATFKSPVPDGTVVTFQMLVPDFGAFNSDGSFASLPWFSVATGTTTANVATAKFKNNAASAYVFKATSGSVGSSEYLSAWAANPDKLPCR